MHGVPDIDDWTALLAPDDGDEVDAVGTGAMGQGPIDPAVQALANRIRRLLTNMQTWQHPGQIRCYCYDGNQINLWVVKGMVFDPTGRITTAGWTSVTNTAGPNSWGYVYAYNAGAGALGMESTTLPPDDGLVAKASDSLRRYITAYRTDGAGKIIPFHRVGKQVRYGGQQSVDVDHPAGYKLVSLANFIPPHARMVDLHLILGTDTTGYRTMSIRPASLTGLTEIGLYAAQPAAGLASEHLEATLFTDELRQLEYIVGGTGAGNGQVSVVGWKE